MGVITPQIIHLNRIFPQKKPHENPSFLGAIILRPQGRALGLRVTVTSQVQGDQFNCRQFFRQEKAMENHHVFEYV